MSEQQEQVITIPITENKLEEPWTEQTEELAYKWMKESKSLSQKHDKAGKNNKYKHAITGLPAILIPSIFSPISVAIGDVEGMQYVNMSGFILTAIFSTINTFFSYNQKYQKHMDYSAFFNDIFTDIQFEMSREKKYRRPHDEFLTKIQLKMDYLNQNAPDL